MADPYSSLLAGAMLLVAAVALYIAAQVTGRAGWRPRVSQALLAPAVLCLTVACVAHWLSGHHPGSPEPMHATAFVRHHPAPFVTHVVVALLSVVTLRPRGRLQSCAAAHKPIVL